MGGDRPPSTWNFGWFFLGWQAESVAVPGDVPGLPAPAVVLLLLAH